MKTRLLICAMVILAISFIAVVPIWAQQAQAHAQIIIIIPPHYGEYEETEKDSPDGYDLYYEEIVLVKDESTITVIPKDTEKEPRNIKQEMESAFAQYQSMLEEEAG